jgi:hypothetical protein
MKTYTFRLIGLLNISFAALGLGALALQSWAFSLYPPEVTGSEGTPVRLAFRTAQLCSIVLLPALGYCGVKLMRLSAKLIIPCAFLFAAEIAYWGLSRLVWPWIFSPNILAATRSGLLNLGFALQILTGYPVLGLIALYFLRTGSRSQDRVAHS